MDYNMMPPPPSSTTGPASTAAGSSVGTGDYTSAHYGGGTDTGQPQAQQLYNNDQQQCTQADSSNQYTSTQYKPHFSGRAHVNRPPPLSLHQTYYRDTLTQSPAQTQVYHDHQSPLLPVAASHIAAASPRHTQSPLVAHSPHVEQSPRGVPQSSHLQNAAHMQLHRQASASHLQSPHMSAHSPHLTTNYAASNGGEISPHPNQAHMQPSMYGPDRTRSPHSGAPYDGIASPIHHKHRHYSDSSQSPHPYAHPAMPRYNNVPNPSPHHYNDPNPSPHHFADPNPSPRHYNEPNPSPYTDPGPHRGHYIDTSQPGTPAAFNNHPGSHPGTPAGYLDSPHHASPHPTRSAYQHFFGPNAHLPPVNGGSGTTGESASHDLTTTAATQYSQQQNTDNNQHAAGVNSAMLHSNPGGQGDAMLSAINLNTHEQDSNIQDGQAGHTNQSMDTAEWGQSSGSQSLKASSSVGSVAGYNSLFDSTSNPPSVDDLMQAADFIASTHTMSLSDPPKDAGKIKPRPKGRPSKSSMSPRSYGAQCPICGKTFNNSSALAKHKLTHSDERKYVCQLCSKAFKRQDHLNGHVMTHRTKKPFECSFEGCTKSYCDARSLRRHLENHHNVPTETLYDMSLTNYGMNNGVNNMYPGYHGDPSTPSPHASPSYPNVPGQQFFRFGGEGANSQPPEASQPFMFGSEAPQPAECTICHKRFKNLPALNGHMRLHGGYTNVKKPDQSDSKSTKSDSASSSVGDGVNVSSRKQASNQNSAGAASSHSNREPGVAISGAQNLMVLNNKYNSMDHNSGSLSHSSTVDDTPSNSNLNQNNNQGNVRQGGGEVVGGLTQFIGGPLHINTLSSSEPTSFPPHPLTAATSQFQFSSADQQRLLNEQIMMQHLQRQLQQQQAAAQTFPGLPPLLGSISHPPVSLPATSDANYLLDIAGRSRADSFHSGIFLSNSPGTSKMSEASQDTGVLTPIRDYRSDSMMMMHPDVEQRRPAPVLQSEPSREDQEVSSIISPKPLDTEQFLAQRKRHASAPEILPDSKSWQKQLMKIDQQQQLNEQYAKEQELAMNVPVHRRRRSSADTHRHNRLNDPFKHPNSYLNSSSDMLTRSDGAMLFRSPPPGGVKKRKHRPEPLSIPPNVAAIQTRLRSPRIWEPGENHGLRHTGKTPPPYTPPPILSPMRSGTGLFCTTYARSNSMGPLSSSLPATKILHLKHQMSIPEEPIQTRAEPQVSPQQLIQPKIEATSITHHEYAQPATQPVIATAVSPPERQPEPAVAEEEAPPPPPETDIQPHINIGDNHQATLPELRKNRREAERDSDRATLLWTPECLDHSLTVQELTAYMDFSCSAAVPGSGSNKEYALHQLYFNKGDLKRAILCLMSKKISPSFVKFIGDYHYQDSDIWTTEDIETYTEAIMKEDKDFNAITAASGDRKTNKQVVEFYYLWKKICPDEYKRLKILRRKKRMNDELYNLRSRGQKGTSEDASGGDPATRTHSDSEDSTSQVSDEGEADDEDMPGDRHTDSMVADILSQQAAQQQHRVIAASRIPTPPPPAFTCEYPGCPAMFNSRAALNGHAKIHVLPRPPSHLVDHHIPGPPAKKIKPEPIPPGGEEFPCKLCGKVFYKVKSRSAHMKSHSVLAKKQRDAAAQAKALQQQQQQQQQYQHGS